MKQNPCRYCNLAYVHNGRHSPSWVGKCAECENIKAHKEYRKFLKENLLKRESQLPHLMNFWNRSG